MAILPSNVAQQVKEMFDAGIESPVELVLVESEDPGELGQLLAEVAESSDKVSYRRLTAAEAASAGLDASLTPAVLLGIGEGEYSRARFLGVPAGHEFGVLIQDILDVSQQKVDLSEETKAFLDGLQEDLHLMVFTTPT